MNIKDIAKIAGVSTSTVSKVLNKKDGNISEQTRKKVLNVVKEYQYVPYSKVKNRKTHIVGLVVDKGHASYEFTYLIDKELSKHGYSVLINYIDSNSSDLMKALRIMHNKQVEGIMLLSVVDKFMEVENYCAKHDLPLVILNASKTHECYSVYHDKKNAAVFATDYLVKLNHKNIAFIGLESESSVFVSGYSESLYNNNIILPEEMIYLFKNEESIAEFKLENLINRDVSALICSDSNLSLTFINKLKDSGILVPDDISVISLLDTKKNEYTVPSVSAISMSIEEIAQRSTSLLVREIDGKTKLSNKNIAILPQLIIRDSTSTPSKNKNVNVSKIITVGSMNMDVTIKTKGILKSGETTIADDTYHIPGGKGANQSIGVSRLGALSYLIGCLGNDADGRKIFSSLQESSVKTKGVKIDNNLVTGKAYVNVFEEGESAIAIYSGANQTLNSKIIQENKSIFEGASYCLLSTEIPHDAIIETIKICNSKKIKIMMKPSAEFEIDESILAKVDYLIPNEKEVDKLVPKISLIKDQAEYLYNLGVENVIITLGSKGSYLKNSQYELEIPSADFIPLDTTGAADAFISALAVYLSEGNDILSALSFATYNAGLSITNLGAQPALPNRARLELYKNDIAQLRASLEGKIK